MKHFCISGKGKLRVRMVKHSQSYSSGTIRVLWLRKIEFLSIKELHFGANMGLCAIDYSASDKLRLSSSHLSC